MRQRNASLNRIWTNKIFKVNDVQENMNLRTPVCKTVTTPGLSCAITGDIPAVIPISPDSLGTITCLTAYEA